MKREAEVRELLINNTIQLVAVGGFEITESHCLIAGCSVLQDADWENHLVRNIWLGKIPTDNFSAEASQLQWITDYQEGGGISVTNPHLVEIDKDNYVLIWEVTKEEPFTSYSYHYKNKIQMVMLDGRGNVTGEIMEYDGNLSDCKPVRIGDQLIWYVTEKSEEFSSFYVFDIVYNGTRADLKYNTITIGGISFKYNAIGIDPGETYGLDSYVSVVPSFLYGDVPLNWSSSDTSVATVTDGKVTGIKPGEAVITASCGKVSAACTITVQDVPIENTWLNTTFLSLTIGAECTLQMYHYPENVTEDTTVVWSSSDNKVAKVERGVVTAVGAGTAVITAQMGTHVQTCQVEVYAPDDSDVTVESIWLDVYNLEMKKGDSYRLKATVYPNEIADKVEMVWYSSNPAVATVVDGLVTAVGYGQAQIVVRAGDKSEWCDVKIKDTVEGFVTRMYQVVLGRNPDPQGLSTWVNGLLSWEFVGADIAKGFIMSDEFIKKGHSNSAYVDILYSAFFDRPADAGGKSTWMDLLKEGKSREFVLAGFVNSDEFDALCSAFGIVRGTMEVEEEIPTGITVSADDTASEYAFSDEPAFTELSVNE